MKKTVKKVLLTTFATVLACSATGLGVNALTASAADETASTGLTDFVMLSDPSIRASNAVDEEGNPIGNGIRFSAEVDKTQYEALDDNGATVTAGTFIMPYNYIQGVTGDDSLKKEHFFGDNACFVWDETTPAQGQYKILHVEASAYETESKIADGETVYRINGSVVNMKNVNLEREYIGVCYLAVTTGETTEYYLADTDEMLNKRSTLQVAQDILLGAPTEMETAIATNYLQTYINWYTQENGVAPTREVVTEYYVDSSEGYSKSNTLSKTEDITMDSVEDFTTAYEAIPTLNGYTYAVGATENVASTIISADNGGALVYYLDKVRNNVIFDGATMTVGLNDDTTDVSVGGYYANPTMYNGVMASSAWGYHGSNSIHVGSTGGGWKYALDITLKEAATFAPTNTFSMMIMVKENEGWMQDINVKVITADGTEYINETYGDMVRGGKVGEVKELTFTLSNAISSVKTISFYMSGKTTEEYTDASGVTTAVDTWKGLQPFYVDYICAENPLYSTASNIALAKDQTSVEIDIGNNLGTTVFSDEEWANMQLSVSYTALNGGSEVDVTDKLENGKFTLQVSAYTNYRIDYTATVGGKSITKSMYVLAYYENVISDFEQDGVSANTWLATASGNSISGEYALKAQDGRTDSNNYPSNWAQYKLTTGVKLTKDCTTVSLWVYSPDERTIAGLAGTGWLYVYGTTASGGNIATHLRADVDTVSLKAGWNYVEYTITNSYVLGLLKAGNIINNFTVYTAVSASGISYHQNLMFDRVVLN